MAHDQKTFILPIAVVGKADIMRLLRELGNVDEFLKQSALRAPGTNVVAPRSSRLLEAVAKENQLNLLAAGHREVLRQQLEAIRDHAPGIHMSFAADPSPLFLQKIVTWLRTEIHPNVLLQIGLQPTIAAGFIMRTPNKYFDFSLRKHFSRQRKILTDKLEGK